MKIFSERYKGILNVSDEDIEPLFCETNEIPYEKRIRIAKLMEEFAEPQLVNISRYDSATETKTALERAIDKLNEKLGYDLIINDALTTILNINNIAILPTHHVFDLIELQFSFLSDMEKSTFSIELNNLFEDLEKSWLLVDGKIIKIDKEQFSCDIRTKALQELEKIKNFDAKFQTALNEMHNSISCYEKQDYVDSINWAERSYESMLKVILGEDKGNASGLLKKYKAVIVDLPETVNRDGFIEKVLMVLPFLRNNASGHGAGEKNIEVSKSYAHLAINMLSTLNTYLIDEYRISQCNSEIQKDEDDFLFE